ncbi:cation:proton antiporter [Candidatus Woesearchaeota archaeon]|nr:cation:proton antiporter [Candidatus Woesearchaeota archaeon]
MVDTFFEIGLVIGIATIISLLVRFLKQPLIIAYILTGIIAGPSLLNVISSTDTITIFSHMGVALLLFVVGLSLDPKVIKEVGVVSAITGVGQVLFTTIIAFLISLALGFPALTALYIGIALSFSSTIIILKLLSDKNEMDTLYGKISIGFLLVQDLIAIFVLMVVSSLNGGMSAESFVLGTALKGISLLVGLILIGIYMLPRITKFAAKSQEMLLLFSISWAFALSLLFFRAGFSIEIGALLAGVTLSFSPYRHEISSKLKPVRDFFLVLFFILMGYQVGLHDITQYIIPIIIFSLLVLIGNPLIVLVLMGLLGHTKRNSFMAGLNVAQISEFSHILIALGISVGHLGSSILSLITAVALITIAISSYLVLYAGKIYPYVSKYLSVFEKKNVKAAIPRWGYNRYDVLLFGCDRVGHDLVILLKKMKKKFLVVDHNPEIVSSLNKKGIKCIYGDASDLELLDELHLSQLKMVVSTIPNFEINAAIINKVKNTNSSAILVIVSHRAEEAIELYEQGASYVILPHLLGGYHASLLIEKHGLNFDNFLKEKIRHLEHLKIATNENKKLISASVRY